MFMYKSFCRSKIIDSIFCGKENTELFTNYFLLPVSEFCDININELMKEKFGIDLNGKIFKACNLKCSDWIVVKRNKFKVLIKYTVYAKL